MIAKKMPEDWRVIKSNMKHFGYIEITDWKHGKRAFCDTTYHLLNAICQKYKKKSCFSIKVACKYDRMVI